MKAEIIAVLDATIALGLYTGFIFALGSLIL